MNKLQTASEIDVVSLEDKVVIDTPVDPDMGGTVCVKPQ